MARPAWAPARPRLVPTGPIEEEPLVIAESRINGGMVTELDPADLKNNQFQVVKNFRIDADKTKRSPGKVMMEPEEPDTDKVLLYTAWERFDGTTTYLRFTATKVYKRVGTTSWTLLTAGAALTASDDDNISFVVINDRFFFSNGIDPIQEINDAITDYAAIAAGVIYKYITGFFNRLVGAVSPTNPVLIGWSGDTNFTVFNPATDVSAGSNPLIEGHSDYAEPITGMFGFASTCLILREKALWIATKQPSASNPFFFSAAFPGKGCDCPGSAIQTGDGITWFDYRTAQVYDYRINGTPDPIGTAIRTYLKSVVTDKDTIRAGYDSIRNQYLLLVPSTNSSTSLLFCYDFQTSSWYVEELYGCTNVFNLSDGGQILGIGDLVGAIGDLMGDIGDLEYSDIVIPGRFYSCHNGMIITDDENSDTFNGETFESVIKSKVFAVDVDDVNIFEIQVKYIPYRAGSFRIQYSRDKGETFTDYKTISFSGDKLGKRQTVICRKNLRVAEYVWQLVSEAGKFALLDFVIIGVSSADKSED